jgi:deferrochelatase/peroxidase EfeB
VASIVAFPNDALDPALCHGDLLLQIGAADATVAEAMLRTLLQAAGDSVRLRWRRNGFREENTVTANGHASTRDLFGFREGAGNLDVNNEELMNRLVWTRNDEPAWAAGGTYAAVRVIQFATQLWDAEPLPLQEATIGRRKTDGAPLGRNSEEETFNYTDDPHGRLIALNSHIRRANPRTPETEDNQILRRGYSYRREADEGLLFICFQKDLEKGFATIQRRLTGTPLDKYVLPIGGGYFFVLPGLSGTTGDYFGRGLIETAKG